MGIEFAVEDGTGVTGANSYVAIETVDDLFLALHGSVPAAWSTKSDPAKRGICRFLSRWIDNLIRGRLPGDISTQERDRLLFPRDDADDNEGRPIVGVPIEIPELLVDLIPFHIARPLETAPGRSAILKSVKAGSVEIEWGDGAPVDRDFSFAFNRLSGILIGGDSGTEVELTKDF